MDAQARFEARKNAIHLLRSGSSVAETAELLGRSTAWVYNWKNRFTGDFESLREQSRAPGKNPRALDEPVKQTIIRVRCELEASQDYIGASAVRAQLKKEGVSPLPSRATIGRVLKAADLTRRWQKQPEKVDYPHLKPTLPHVLCQVDIVPHYLPGGQLVANFNAIDVVSSYVSGYSYANKTSTEAFDFLWWLWREQGIAKYTQFDNEGCFSGGSTHPYVLGKVVRLGLFVGTEVVFSPPYHPQSNGYVERFHQDYSKGVWKKLTLQTLDDVNEGAQRFFNGYRHSGHKRRLDTMTPAQLHQNPRLLTASLTCKKLALTEGQVHFIRRVASTDEALEPGYIQILNVPWKVGDAHQGKGVWATLKFEASQQAWLRVYDAAPDVLERKCLAIHRFPLKETIHPAAEAGSTFQRTTPLMKWVKTLYEGLFRQAALW